jgi:hypothetical protein
MFASCTSAVELRAPSCWTILLRWLPTVIARAVPRTGSDSSNRRSRQRRPRTRLRPTRWPDALGVSGQSHIQRATPTSRAPAPADLPARHPPRRRKCTLHDEPDVPERQQDAVYDEIPREHGGVVRGMGRTPPRAPIERRRKPTITMAKRAAAIATKKSVRFDGI